MCSKEANSVSPQTKQSWNSSIENAAHDGRSVVTGRLNESCFEIACRIQALMEVNVLYLSYKYTSLIDILATLAIPLTFPSTIDCHLTFHHQTFVRQENFVQSTRLTNLQKNSKNINIIEIGSILQLSIPPAGDNTDDERTDGKEFVHLRRCGLVVYQKWMYREKKHIIPFCDYVWGRGARKASWVSDGGSITTTVVLGEQQADTHQFDSR